MTKEAATPRLSATVLLMRNDPALKVLMVERHYEIDFASGALVFPGGKADSDDERPEWEGRIDGETSGEQRIARIAAAREAFEEAGILLARPDNARGPGAALVGLDVAERLSPFRRAVDKREKSFFELMAENSLTLALDQLVHYGHWITPTFMPKRFDTHFYLAETPPGQVATQDGVETTKAIWIEPEVALTKADANEVEMLFPTRMNLRKLSVCTEASEAIQRFTDDPVISVLPERVQDENGDKWLQIPEVPGYGVTRVQKP